MRKSKIFVVLWIVILPACLIVGAYKIVNYIFHGGGFTRIIKAGLIEKNIHASIGEQVTGISGISSEHLCFSTTTPGTIIITNQNFENKLIYRMPLKPDDKIFNAFNEYVDDLEVEVYAGNIPAIMRGNLSKQDSMSFQPFSGNIYSGIVKCSKGSYIVRRYDEKIMDFVLTKVNMFGSEAAREKDVSTIIHDDGMSTQGTLLFDSHSGKVVFIYKLFNEFFYLDSNLNLLYRKHTIDTISKANIQVREFNKGSVKVGTFSSPPRYTNNSACLTGRHLLINSLIRADNETDDDFDRNAVIDVYDLSNGNYQYSFYLAGYESKRLTDFVVYEHSLIAVFDKGKQIVVFITKDEL